LSEPTDLIDTSESQIDSLHWTGVCTICKCNILWEF